MLHSCVKPCHHATATILLAKFPTNYFSLKLSEACVNFDTRKETSTTAHESPPLSLSKPILRTTWKTLAGLISHRQRQINMQSIPLIKFNFFKNKK